MRRLSCCKVQVMYSVCSVLFVSKAHRAVLHDASAFQRPLGLETAGLASRLRYHTNEVRVDSKENNQNRNGVYMCKGGFERTPQDECRAKGRVIYGQPHVYHSCHDIAVWTRLNGHPTRDKSSCGGRVDLPQQT